MRLIFVRHGESEGNARRILQGHAEFGLTPLGLRQAEATAGALREFPVSQVFSSPLSRAMQTAEVLTGAIGLASHREPDLAEYDIGEVSGLTGAEIRERFPEVAASWARRERARLPGEEGRDRFFARVSAFLERCRGRDEVVVAVTHGGVINAACHLVLEIDYSHRGAFNAGNCSISEIVTDRTGGLVLQRLNDTCHLARLE